MILHVDMDAFFAAVEVREQPELAGRPLIVGGSATGRGVVAAASYEARKFGIHSAMPVAQALRRCSDVICLPVRMDLYRQVSRQIREIFERYTTQVEPLSLDEAFLDVSASERLFGSTERMARQIKAEILAEQGLTASVGVAPNKFLAKLASDLDKPDGFVVVTEKAIQTFLDPLPVGRLWGVGRATHQVFERFGIRTVAQVRQQPVELLESWFGKWGRQLWELAHGRDSRPVVSDQQARSVSHETTFVRDVTDPRSMRAWLMHLTEQVAWRLRQAGLSARTVQVKIRYPDFRTHTRSRTLSVATDETESLWQVAQALFEDCLQQRHNAVRLIGMGASGLGRKQEHEPAQGDLFAPLATQTSGIDTLTDRINTRFGKGAIARGSGVRRPS